MNRVLCRSEWTEDGQLWVQYVSSTPATRQDVITLQVCASILRTRRTVAVLVLTGER